MSERKKEKTTHCESTDWLAGWLTGRFAFIEFDMKISGTIMTWKEGGRHVFTLSTANEFSSNRDESIDDK